MSEMDTEHFSPYRADGKLVRLSRHDGKEVETDCCSMGLSVLLLGLSSLLDKQLYRSWLVCYFACLFVETRNGMLGVQLREGSCNCGILRNE
jgi:hypothetical protein